MSRNSSDPLLRARAGMAHGVAASALGNFRESVAYIDETYPRLESLPGAYWELAVLENTRAQCLFWLGNFSSMKVRVDDLMRRAEHADDVFSTMMGGVLDSMLTLASGNVGLACSLLEKASQLWTYSGYTSESFFALKTRVWCDLYEGDSQGATAHLLDDEVKLKRTGLLGVQLVKAEFACLRGVVLLARCRDDEARPLSKVIQCIKIQEKIGRPYTLGYAAVLKTGLALLQGQAEAARAHAREASQYFYRLHMLGHSAAVLLSVSDGSERQFLVEQGVVAPEQWRRVYQPV